MVHVPPPPDSDDRAFVPAAPRPRRDGWTAAVQAAFVAALAGGDSVTAACRRVRRSRNSAYTLRERADAAAFAAAWDAAVAEIDIVATGTAMDRVLEGTLKPVIYRGRIIGQRLVHDDRLLMHMLRRSRPRGVPADPLTQFDRAMRAIDTNRNADFGETF